MKPDGCGMRLLERGCGARQRVGLSSLGPSGMPTARMPFPAPETARPCGFAALGRYAQPSQQNALSGLVCGHAADTKAGR